MSYRNKNNLSVKESFESFFSPEPNTGCWIWTGYLTNRGYGKFRSKLAHRISYNLYIQKVADGMVVCHHCDNPWCVNPYHLFVGTQKDNVNDMFRKKRANRPRGTSHHKSKIDEAIVRKIREGRKMGLTQKKLGAIYSLNQSTVWGIVNNNTWKHVL